MEPAPEELCMLPDRQGRVEAGKCSRVVCSFQVQEEGTARDQACKPCREFLCRLQLRAAAVLKG